ncbi:ThiF family adenylyltransferase [Desulfobacter latus]|uniref:ThiF family adenylyltransferase n=1 Tax=Desulfobacter latus TaxID=2292 RepID=A0A850TAN0_9BACT|nr:ThiF family adenylyltransferase [Desulfobacter latus]NWH06445.1 ThiF family adenylyltransferase [Desulfobacter latus]
MREVVIHNQLWERVCESLFPPSGEEGFAFCVARLCKRRKGSRFLLDIPVPLSEKDIEYRWTAGVALTRKGSDKLNIFSAKLAEKGYIPVHVHSHPEGIPDFSAVDNHYEKTLSLWLKDHGQPFLISVLAPRKGIPMARLWHKGRRFRTKLRVGLKVMSKKTPPFLPALDRQRAFGPLFSTCAANLRVGIIGVGGVGLPVAEQLARCGVRSFLLMDPDTVEKTNLNRLQGLTPKDVGRKKVDVVNGIIQRAGMSVGTRPFVTTIDEDIYNASDRQKNLVKECDLVLALTDDHLSRLVCLELALAGGAEYLQAGVDVRLGNDGAITNLMAEVSGAESGRYCPLCLGRLDPGTASLEARKYVGGEVWGKAKKDGYIPEVASPAVMSLNAVAAGMLVAEIQRRISGLGITDLIQIDLNTGGSLFETDVDRKLIGDCIICGRKGHAQVETVVDKKAG